MTIKNEASNNGNQIDIVRGDVNIYNYNKARIPSLLPKFIEVLAEKYLENSNSIPNSGIPSEYKIEDKIVYNNLIKYKFIVEDYGFYYKICTDALDIIDNNNIGGKTKILDSIKEYYKKEKRRLISSNSEVEDVMEIIRENADNIIDFAIDEVRHKIENGYNGEKISIEDVHICCPIFICYAFAECKILERPIK